MKSDSKTLSRRSFLKRASGAAVALLGGSVLAGCAQPTAVPAKPVVQPTAVPAVVKKEKVTLKWAHISLTEDQFTPTWKEIVADFQKDFPDVTIEPMLIARADFNTKVITMLKANEGPDIISGPVIGNSAYNGYFKPLDDLLAKDKAFKAAWSAPLWEKMSFKGKIYGVPGNGGIYAEFYNRDLVVKAGLDPTKPPKTWAEYLEWAKKLTTGSQFALALLGGPTNTTTRVALSWVFTNGGDILNEAQTESTWSSPKVVEAIKYYTDLDLVHKVAAAGAVQTNYAEQTVMFAQEKIAMMRNAYWGWAKVVGDNPAIESKMFCAFPPTNGKEVVLNSIGGESIGKDCKNPDLAFEFLKYSHGKKASIRMAKDAKWIPTREDVYTDPEILKDKVMAQFLDFARKSQAYPPSHPMWGDVDPKFVVETIQTILLKQATAEEALKALDKRIMDKMKDYA